MNIYVHRQDVKFGVEIQPPLTDTALEGLQAALTHPFGGSERTSALAKFVVPTRQDANGTALSVEARGEGLDSAAMERHLNDYAAYLAHNIGNLINPAGIYPMDLYFSGSDGKMEHHHSPAISPSSR